MKSAQYAKHSVENSIAILHTFSVSIRICRCNGEGIELKSRRHYIKCFFHKMRLKFTFISKIIWNCVNLKFVLDIKLHLLLEEKFLYFLYELKKRKQNKTKEEKKKKIGFLRNCQVNSL